MPVKYCTSYAKNLFHGLLTVHEADDCLNEILSSTRQTKIIVGTFLPISLERYGQIHASQLMQKLCSSFNSRDRCRGFGKDLVAPRAP